MNREDKQKRNEQRNKQRNCVEKMSREHEQRN